jgi:choline dehydrogenase-like flavoprotein
MLDGAGASAVVAPRLDVDGVAGQWVAHASVAPAPRRGHLDAALAMIAKRAAGFVQTELKQAAAA